LPAGLGKTRTLDAPHRALGRERGVSAERPCHHVTRRAAAEMRERWRQLLTSGPAQS